MNIAVIGTGGVGGYFGGKLAIAGHNVTFIARGQHLEKIQKKGLQVKSILGDFEVHPVKATNNIEEIEAPDLILVAVKAWQVKDLAPKIKNIITKDTLIIPLQNGILAAEELTESIPDKNILGGLCRIFSYIEEPGVINHFGVEPTIVFGELNNELSERAQTLQNEFSLADINVILTKDIQAELWKKFISICTSALLAVTRSTYGQATEKQETRQMMIDLLTEGYDLSKKAGINLPEDYVENAMKFIDSFDYHTTSSLTRDVWEGKPSEIEYQNGTIVKLGEKYGVKTPVNSFIYQSILAQEKVVQK